MHSQRVSTDCVKDILIVVFAEVLIAKMCAALYAYNVQLVQQKRQARAPNATMP
jgi:hypothetical protein